VPPASRCGAREMAERSILMASGARLLGHLPDIRPYSPQAALDGLTRRVGCEWGPAGLTVNAHRAGRVFASRSKPGCSAKTSGRGERSEKAFSRACPRGGRRGRSISQGRCCSWLERRVGLRYRPISLCRRRPTRRDDDDPLSASAFQARKAALLQHIFGILAGIGDEMPEYDVYS